MQIDFKALEQALAPIEEIGQGELTFEAASTTITLRVLLPAEEVEAQRYAASVLQDEVEGDHLAVDYLDRFRIACLSHSVVAIGDMDFRGLEYVETGEVLPNGSPIKVTKSKALRTLLARWTRSTLTVVYSKFSDLTSKAEAAAESLIEYTPSDLSAELDRLNKRVAEITAKMEHEKMIEKAKFTEQVGSISKVTTEAMERSPATPAIAAPEPNPEQALPAASRRTGPISPTTAPPPAAREPRAAQPAPAEQPVHRAAPPRADSSFINPDDDESMNAALDAEHNRIVAMRRRAAEGQPAVDDASALEQIHPQTAHRRTPPHLEAKKAEADVGVLDAAAQTAQEIGEIDGKPVFALPAQDLGVKAPPAPADARSAINPPAATVSENPRFKARIKP